MNKYPRATKFLQEHPELTLDQALEFFEKEETAVYAGVHLSIVSRG